MKKTSFLILTLCSTALAFAQNTQPQLRTPMAKTTRFGIRGGVNLADLRAKGLPAGTPATDANSKTAFNGGVFVNIPLGTRNIKFQPEISYSSQGGKLRTSGSTANTYEQDLDYINLPLNFQFAANNGLFVQTGPQVGFLVGAERSGGTAGFVNSGNKNDFDKFDLAWGAGVGYLSRIGLGVDLRFTYGIANVVADDAAASTTTAPSLKGGTWKNNVAQFSLIYQFGAYK